LQYSLELLDVSTLVAEVAERIPGATHYFERLLHRNISFNRFNQALMRSISRRGVLMPYFDFFWNACMDDPDFVGELQRVR
jgi:hypothetical protein